MYFCTVQELLTVQPATVMAGWAGRHNRVCRVVQPVAAGPADKLADSLVLLGAESRQADIPALIVECCNSAPAGILLSGYTAPLPQQVLDMAETNAVPLLSCQMQLTARELQQALELAAESAQTGRLTGLAEQCSRRQLANFALDLPGVLAQLAGYLQNPVVVVDAACQLLAQAGSDRFLAGDELTGLVNSARLPVLQRKSRAQAGEEFYLQQLAAGEMHELTGYIAPLVLAGQLFGYLMAFAAGPEFNELDLLRIRETGVSCLHLLIVRRQVAEVETKYKEHFLYDLLYNNFDSEEALIKRARYWGWELSKPQWLLVIEADDFQHLPDKADILETIQLTVSACLRVRYRYAITSIMQDQLVVIIPGTEGDAKSIKAQVRKLAQSLQTEIGGLFPRVTFSIGIGKHYLAAADLCRSYQEAKHALALGRFSQEKGHITHFEDLGIIRLLSHVSLDQLDDYYKEQLAAILEHDEKNATNYLEILQVYFQQNGDLNLMAEKLFMHPNTVRYRLRKLEELLDTDLQKIESRVSLSIACKIARMRKPN